MTTSIPKHPADANKIVRIHGIKAADMSERLAIIEQYLAEGCTLIALAPGDNSPEYSLSPNRKDATNTAKTAKTTDIAEVVRWYTRKPNINIGKYLPTNRFALDIDVKVGKDGNAAKGIESLAKLEASLGSLPRTRKTQTPSGGFHLEFLLPDDLGIEGRNNFSAGIDARCGGNLYLAAPPSTRSYGNYVLVDDTPCAELPEAWIAYVKEFLKSTKAAKQDGDKTSVWLAEKNKAFAESHPTHISPLLTYVAVNSARDIALESCLWSEEVGSHKLLSVSSKSGKPGCSVLETSEGVEVIHDHHEVLKDVGASGCLNAFQLRKYILMYQSEEELTEEDAFELVMKEARALIPSDYTLFHDLPKGKTIGELNAIADKTGIPASELHDSAWFLDQINKLPRGEAKAQAGRDLLTQLAKYHKVFSKATHTEIRDKLVAADAITSSDAKAILKAAVADHRLSMGMSRREAMVEEMNLTHYNAIVGGKNVIVTLEEREVVYDGRMVIQPYVEYTAPKELRGMYINKPTFDLENPITGEVTPCGQLDAWMRHPKANTCPKGVCFVPNPPGTKKYEPTDQLNLFQGWSTDPAPGDWSVVADHYLNIMCDGDVGAYEYLLNWMARFVQQPTRQGRVIPVFQGEKRTGKGLGIEFLVRIASRHAITILNREHLLGKHNGHLEDKLLVFSDEAVFVGDKEAMERLKGLATEPRMTIEHKFMAARPDVPNRLKVIMATNSEWVVPATKDEIRYLVLKVNSTRKGDNAYFKKLADAVHDKAVHAAFLHDMMQRDISNFNVEDIPRTAALEEQIALSFDPIWQWWNDCLRQGYVDASSGDAFSDDVPEWVEQPSASGLYDAFSKWCDMQRVGTYHRMTATSFGKKFHEIYHRKRNKSGNAYVLGSHGEAIQAFATYQRISVETIMGVDDEEEIDLLS